MKLEWTLERPEQAAHTGFLSLVADCCQVAEGLFATCGAHILLTSNKHIQALNASTRGRNCATDVLSFPTVAYPMGKTARGCPSLLRREYDEEIGGCMLGDIVISLEQAQAQAQAFGHSLTRELGYLLAHGLFHLMGYDHIDALEKKEMRTMEEKALRNAGITRTQDSPHIPSDEQLLALARQAMERAYVPYSRYRVGACLLCEDGRMFQGCNIENASFGLTNCAERTALFKAVSEGAHSFVAIAIAAEGSAPYPCGACRQVLHEFAPDIRVLVTWGGNQVDKTNLASLLPHGFGPKDLP